MKIEPLAGASANSERREFHRRKFNGKIEIEWGSAVLTGTVLDIGPQGLFLELSPPLWVGARFLAHIVTNPILHLDCVVRRVEPGKGIAITFNISEESGKTQLAALLAALPRE